MMPASTPRHRATGFTCMIHESISSASTAVTPKKTRRRGPGHPVARRSAEAGAAVASAPCTLGRSRGRRRSCKSGRGRYRGAPCGFGRSRGRFKLRVRPKPWPQRVPIAYGGGAAPCRFGRSRRGPTLQVRPRPQGRTLRVRPKPPPQGVRPKPWLHALCQGGARTLRVRPQPRP